MDNVTISREKMRQEMLEKFRQQGTFPEAHNLFTTLDYMLNQAVTAGGEIARLYESLQSAIRAAWQDYVSEVAH